MGFLDKLNDLSSALLGGDDGKGELKDGTFIVSNTTKVLTSRSFQGCSQSAIQRIVLPSSLKEIDGEALRGLSNLQCIDFSNVSQLKTIKKGTFYRTPVTELVFPEGVVEIEDEAIVRCSNLQHIVFPSTLEKLGTFVHECKNLGIIDTSKVFKLKKTSSFVVKDCSIERFILPQGIKNVDFCIASETTLKELVIPASVEKMTCINREGKHNVDVYLYSDHISNIKGICKDINNLYVLPKHYDLYKKKMSGFFSSIDDVNLCEMPEDMYEFDSSNITHFEPKIIEAPEPQKPPVQEENPYEQEDTSEESNYVFEVPEGVTFLDGEKMSEYVHGFTIGCKVILPSTLRRTYGEVFPTYVGTIDFSKVSELRTIEENTFANLRFIEEIIIPEGVTMIRKGAFKSCPCLKRIVLPSSIEVIGNEMVSDCPAVEIIDMSLVDGLDCMPETIADCCQIKRFVFPKNLSQCDGIAIESRSLKEVYVPSSMRDFDFLYDPSDLDDKEAKVDIYCYAPTIEDITDFCESKDNLYVLPEHYEGYKSAIKELVDDGDDEDEFPTLLVMPEEKRDFYNKKYYYSDLFSKKRQLTKAKKALLAKIISSVAEHAKENPVADKQASLTADSTSTEDGLFSKELDELINAAVEGGELTAKKREIVMRRAAKEGADPDEVEMILEARLFEQQNK